MAQGKAQPAAASHVNFACTLSHRSRAASMFQQLARGISPRFLRLHVRRCESSGPASFLARYEQLVGDGALLPDPRQRSVAEALSVLNERMIRFENRRLEVGDIVYEVVVDENGGLEHVAGRHESFHDAAAFAERLRSFGSDSGHGASPAAENARRSTRRSGSLARPPSTSGAAGSAPTEDAQRVAPTSVRVRQARRVPCRTADAPDAFEALASPPRVPRGLYVHGHVGSGKSLLVDLFFDHCPLRRRRRVHFHDFMLDVHARVHAWKRHDLEEHGRVRTAAEAARPERDALRHVARALARDSWLLCFDEFQVTDVADALIMRTLFAELWGAGSVVVATSNRPPEELYQGGLNRGYFLPFLDALRVGRVQRWSARHGGRA